MSGRVVPNNGWVVPNSGRVVLGSWGRLDLNPSISGVSGYIMGHGKDSKNQNSFCMTNKNSTIFTDNIRSIYSLLTAYLFIYTPFLSKWFVVWFVCLRYFEICEEKSELKVDNSIINLKINKNEWWWFWSFVIFMRNKYVLNFQLVPTSLSSKFVYILIWSMVS